VSGPEQIRFAEETWVNLILLARTDRIYLEGSILRLVDTQDSAAYQSYVDEARRRDRATREKRSRVTQTVQKQNRDLQSAHETITAKQERVERALQEAETARAEAEEARARTQEAMEQEHRARVDAENAREEAVKDLDYMQKRTQFELMGQIVRVALFLVVGVGSITTILYALALFGPGTSDDDTTLLANTWSNMFGILLTNSFSIIGTIMGVKYATDKAGGD